MKTKRCLECEKELPISNFYQTKTGEYDWLCKQHRKENIIDNQPWTALDACKYFDIPFIEDIWFSMVDSAMHNCVSHKKQYDTIFGKYLSRMKLKSLQNYSYKDSLYLNNISYGIKEVAEKYRKEFLPLKIKEYFDITNGRKNEN